MATFVSLNACGLLKRRDAKAPECQAMYPEQRLRPAEQIGYGAGALVNAVADVAVAKGFGARGGGACESSVESMTVRLSRSLDDTFMHVQRAQRPCAMAKRRAVSPMIFTRYRKTAALVPACCARVAT
ncbi:MAG: hypothetical protein QOD50_1367 [Actinomycetota bacterium]|nr:hypothetical protein [Actinomycetota bacterium]